MTITIEVNALNEKCVKCPRLEVGRTRLYAGDRVIENIYHCDHIDFCRDVLGVDEDD